MPSSKQFVEEAFQHHHLSASVNEVFVDNGLFGALFYRPVEKEWMRADFSELHDRVLQLHIVNFLD